MLARNCVRSGPTATRRPKPKDSPRGPAEVISSTPSALPVYAAAAARAPNVIRSFGEGADGRLYVVAGDALYEILTDGPRVPASQPWQRALLACALMAIGALLGRRARRARGA